MTCGGPKWLANPLYHNACLMSAFSIPTLEVISGHVIWFPSSPNPFRCLHCFYSFFFILSLLSFGIVAKKWTPVVHQLFKLKPVIQVLKILNPRKESNWNIDFFLLESSLPRTEAYLLPSLGDLQSFWTKNSRWVDFSNFPFQNFQIMGTKCNYESAQPGGW